MESQSLALKTLVLLAVTGVHSLWYDDCGVSSYEDAGNWPGGRSRRGRMIVGGVNARPNEFPWQVSLRSPPGDSGVRHFCGGVLISPDWVLTAAHCIVGDAPDSLVVVLGEHDTTITDAPERLIHNVSKIEQHEDYGGPSENYDNDIALLRLSESVVLSPEIQPACQPVAGNTYVAETCQVSGWGTTEWGESSYPTILQWTEMRITNNTYCEEKLMEKSPSYYVTENMVCASDEGDHTERDSCQGDSGGPLTVINSEGLFSIVGLTSWGYRCADTTPGVYTRVTQYIDWVQGIMDSG